MNYAWALRLDLIIVLPQFKIRDTRLEHDFRSAGVQVSTERRKKYN